MRRLCLSGRYYKLFCTLTIRSSLQEAYKGANLQNTPSVGFKIKSKNYLYRMHIGWHKTGRRVYGPRVLRYGWQPEGQYRGAGTLIHPVLAAVCLGSIQT